jgi:hypothetical protein
MVMVMLVGLLAVACSEGQKPEVSPSVTATVQSPTPSAVVPTTVAPITPAVTPNPECGADEKAYVDPDGRFSVCYLDGMEAVTAQNDPESKISVTVRFPMTDVNSASVTIGWEMWPEYVPCQQVMDVVKNQHMEEIAVSGTGVEACVQDLYEVLDPERYRATTIDFAVPRTSGEQILVLAGYTGEGITRSGLPAREVVERVLGSIRVY